MTTTGPRLAVLDYGIGNLRSAEKALQRQGANARLTADPAEIEANRDDWTQRWTEIVLG